MQANDETPQPRKKKPSKKTDDQLYIKSYTNDQIKKILKEALLDNIEDSKQRSNQDIDALVSTLEEFLRSFILIGYNLKNEPITITHAVSQLDADALYTSLSRLFISINGGSSNI